MFRQLACLLALVACPALAHDLWVDREASAYVLYQGHRHSAHSGPEVVPYEVSSVKEALCVADNGGTKALPLGKTHPVRVTGDCATLLISFSTGYWSKTAWETRNQPKTGISGVMKSWYSEESLKLLERWRGASAAVVGQGLEISPVTNPLLAKEGDKLTFLVTDGGKPVAGVPVAYAGETRGATGSDGKVGIRLRQTGRQLISASLESPLADGKADSSIRTATLQFEMAP